MWVGGYKKDGRWYWSKGVTDDLVTADAWITGQPDNYAGRQACMTLISNKSHWTIKHPVAEHERFGYDDGYCDIYPQNYICERC